MAGRIKSAKRCTCARAPAALLAREEPLSRRLVAEAEVVSYLMKQINLDEPVTRSMRWWNAAYQRVIIEFLTGHDELREEFERYHADDPNYSFGDWMRHRYIAESRTYV
jgi:hypothetical protein